MNHNGRHQPLVSIALPVFNSAKTLRYAILSVIWQACCDWELLIMDDGSTDSTIRVAQNFKDPRIFIVSDGIHRGLPAQLNRAVQLAQGRYFARMDADDIAYPSRLEKQIEFLELHPQIDLVGGAVAVFNSAGLLLGLRRPPASHTDICARPWAGFPIAHPTWMGRLEWFRRNPYRTDALRMEDRELLFRTYADSHFANVPEVLLGYREDSLSLGKLLLARKNTCRLTADYARDHMKFTLAARVIGGQVGRFLVETLALSTGLGYRILRHRALPPTPAEAQEWKRVWTAVTLMADAEACGTRAAEVTNEARSS